LKFSLHCRHDRRESVLFFPFFSPFIREVGLFLPFPFLSLHSQRIIGPTLFPSFFQPPFLFFPCVAPDLGAAFPFPSFNGELEKRKASPLLPDHLSLFSLIISCCCVLFSLLYRGRGRSSSLETSPTAYVSQFFPLTFLRKGGTGLPWVHFFVRAMYLVKVYLPFGSLFPRFPVERPTLSDGHPFFFFFKRYRENAISPFFGKVRPVSVSDAFDGHHLSPSFPFSLTGISKLLLFSFPWLTFPLSVRNRQGMLFSSLLSVFVTDFLILDAGPHHGRGDCFPPPFFSPPALREYE